MADTTVLTPAQISAAADAGADRVVVQPVTRKVRFKDTRFSFRFRRSDGAGAGKWLVSLWNEQFNEDVDLVDISGPSAADALNNADKNALIAILEKIHVGRVMP